MGFATGQATLWFPGSSRLPGWRLPGWPWLSTGQQHIKGGNARWEIHITKPGEFEMSHPGRNLSIQAFKEHLWTVWMCSDLRCLMIDDTSIGNWKTHVMGPDPWFLVLNALGDPWVGLPLWVNVLCSFL